MRLLLTTLNAKYIHTNLAIRLLYQLNRSHEELHWQEFSIKENADAIAEQCVQYDVVAFSCYIWNITPTLEVARKIKALNPACKILLGGPEVSYEWHEVIAQDCIDYIIIGEGEIPFQKFLQQYPHLDEVPSFVQKIDGGIHYNSKEESFDVQLLADINPYADDDPATLAHRVLYLETSRGCPYKCAFCLASLDNKVRYLPIDRIKQNLLFLMQHGQVIKFLDRTFNIKKDFTIDIFQFILDHHKGNNVFQFEITADIVHPDIIAFVQQHIPKGLLRFEIGIQTVNQQANLAVSRKQNFEKTSRVIRQLQDYIDLHLDLIVGLPLDEWSDIKLSIEEVFALYPKELQLGFLKFLKGTPVRENYAEHGYEFDSTAPYQIISSNYLSAEQLQLISLAEHALEIYWNKRKALHTFKYASLRYPVFDFMLGLGQSLETANQLHSYSQRSVYEVLYKYVENTFPHDEVLKQLVSIDFALSYKVKPTAIFYPEIKNQQLITSAITGKGFTISGKRQMWMSLGVDLNRMLHQNKLEYHQHLVCIDYSGTQWPQMQVGPCA